MKRDNKFISNYEFILYYFLSSTFIIEFINGITGAENSNSASFGIVIRGLFLIFFIYIVLKYDLKKFLIILFILFLLFINIFLSYYMNHYSIDGIMFDIKVLFKIMFPISTIFAINVLFKKKLFRMITLEKSIYNNLYSVCILMALSYILKIGKSTYGDAGFKGAFNQVNTITASIIVMFIFGIERLYVSKKKLVPLIFTIATFIVLILLGTKSSFLFIPIIILTYMFYDFKNVKKKLVFAVSIVVVTMFIKTIIGGFFTSQFQDVMIRQKYFMLSNQNNIMTYLLSGRDKLFIGELQNFFNNFSIRRVLIGIGNYYEQIELARNLGIYTFKGIEMDLFDIFFSYGIFGVIVTYFLTIYIFIKNKKKSLKMEQRPYTISFIFLIVFSVLGGHIFGDLAGGTFMSLMVAAIYMINKGECM